MIILRLAMKSLANRWLTAVLAVASIALSVALLLGVEKVRNGARQSFADTISGTDLIVGFPVVGAAFGMPEDDMGRARIPQHPGRDVAGMGARNLGMAILPAGADRGLSDGFVHPGQQRCRRTDQHLDRGIGMGGHQCAHLRQAVARAVHLPVSCREFLPHLPSSLLAGAD